MNARSRLNQKTPSQDHFDISKEKSNRIKLAKKPLSDNHPYIRHIPLLILSSLCIAWLLRVAITTYPQEIANFLIPQSYLPILVPFFLACLFLFGYLTLNIKKGFVLAFFSTLLVLFRLQQIAFEIWWLIIFIVIALITTTLTKK